MLYCPRCKVSVAGARLHCPLCGCELTGTPDPAGEVFPPSGIDKNLLALLFRIWSFACVAAGVVCTVINLCFPGRGWWCLFAIAGICCAWLVTLIAIRKKSNLMKNILWQLAIVSALALLWDYFTGKRGWAMDFVLPCLYFCAMIALFVLARARRTPTREYMVYFLLVGLLALLPALFIAAGWTHVMLPSAICAGTGVLFSAFHLIFYGRAVKREISKNLHL